MVCIKWKIRDRHTETAVVYKGKKLKKKERDKTYMNTCTCMDIKTYSVLRTCKLQRLWN